MNWLETSKNLKNWLEETMSKPLIKRCCRCVKWKPLEMFITDNRRNDGRGSRCYACNNIVEKERGKNSEVNATKKKLDANWAKNNKEKIKITKNLREEKRTVIINAVKSQPCVDCHYSFPSEAMELDHVRGEKLYNISEMGGMSMNKLFEELEKCDPRCCNCHRIKTQSNKPPSQDERTVIYRKYMNELKSAPCTDCHFSFLPVAMDFDHVPERGEKVFELSNMAHFPKWKVEEELAKCDLVCANCHRIRTTKRIEQKKLTENNKCLDCQAIISSANYRCKTCSDIFQASKQPSQKRIQWPSKEELIGLITKLAYSGAAKKLGCNLSTAYIYGKKLDINPQSFKKPKINIDSSSS